MVESNREAWHEITKRTQDAGADGIELNFGCPHGMSERGMGAAVGQVPDYACMITEWVKEVATIPVMVKLTPNVGDVTADRPRGRPRRRRCAVAHQHHQLDHGRRPRHARPEAGRARRRQPRRLLRPGRQADRAAHGRAVAGDPRCNVPISGIGGIQAWQDAVEFLLLGAGSVQVCTAVMHYGFRIVEQLDERPGKLDARKGLHERVSDFVGKSAPRIKQWGDLDLNYKVVAEIDQQKCIHCGLCYIACEDGAHQSIRWDKVADGRLCESAWPVQSYRSGGVEVLPGAGGDYVNQFTIKQDTCVGCNMCSPGLPGPGLHSR